MSTRPRREALRELSQRKRTGPPPERGRQADARISAKASAVSGAGWFLAVPICWTRPVRVRLTSSVTVGSGRQGRGAGGGSEVGQVCGHNTGFGGEGDMFVLLGPGRKGFPMAEVGAARVLRE